MLSPSAPFYVVTIGRMYLRYPDSTIICQHLASAARFDTIDDARRKRDEMADARRKQDALRKPRKSERGKPLGIHCIHIKEVT